MEEQKKNCSSKEHENEEANFFCQQCQIYMCKKCENIHSKLCQHHNPYNLDQNIDDVFTGLCKIKNHSDRLNYFCENHNQLCCAECITKIKDNEYGQHRDCNVYTIKNIKKDKKVKLNENIKTLEELSKTIEKSISDLTTVFQRIIINKENLKLEVQQIFTKLKNEINQREDKLLLEIDKKFDELFFKEDVIKESNMLPNKIKLSLEKGKKIKNDWNNENKLNLLINDCINIENNIKSINNINNNLNKCRCMNIEVKFNLGENGINELVEKIKAFGNLYYDNFKFKQCPKKISENKKYKIIGKKRNILTKTGKDCNWMGTLCENILDKSKEYYWKIKILNTKDYNIMVGVAPSDFNIDTSLYENYGWYYNLNDSSLYSGGPYFFSLKEKKEKINYSDDENKEPKIIPKPRKEKIVRKYSDNEKKENKTNLEYKRDKYFDNQKKEKIINYSDNEEKKEIMNFNDNDNEKINENKIKNYEKGNIRYSSNKKKEKDNYPAIRKKRKEQYAHDDKIEEGEYFSNKKEEEISKEKKSNIKDEIIVNINFEKKILRFIQNNEEKAKYQDFPIDKPLSPAIFLYNINDSVEIE